MSLKNDIINAVNGILNKNMNIEDVSFVPDINTQGLTFGLSGKRFQSVCLFIDMRGSTAILEKHNSSTVIKIHKAYFITILKIVRYYKGEVRSFNGDSILAFFPGHTSESIENAVKSAMKLKYMLLQDDDCLKNKVKSMYDTTIDIGIGLDLGSTVASKVGHSGYNNQDLIWIGRNVNKSVKISDVRNLPYNIGISKRLYDKLPNSVLYDNDGKNMWSYESLMYNNNYERIYKTTYYWRV